MNRADAVVYMDKRKKLSTLQIPSFLLRDLFSKKLVAFFACLLLQLLYLLI
jgi:hypothetical protein